MEELRRVYDHFIERMQYFASLGNNLAEILQSLSRGRIRMNTWERYEVSMMIMKLFDKLCEENGGVGQERNQQLTDAGYDAERIQESKSCFTRVSNQ